MPLAYIPSPPHGIWRLGPVPVRLQAACVVAGILLALVIAERRYRRAGGRPGTVWDVAATAIPAGLIPVAAGVVLAASPGAPWQQIRSVVDTLGYPGAAALGTLAAWVVCRRHHLGFAPLAGAAAPAMAFGHAVADLGGWVAQQGYGRPSALWWAVQISPAHRLPGYENFATFQPLFIYEALWDVATGVTVIWATRRFSVAGDKVFAVCAMAYTIGVFAVFWLGIGHLPLVLGIQAGELGDGLVAVGALVYLVRTRRKRTPPFQVARKSALESDSSVM
jgi:prolipoprotein diacylglyceryltransferase